MSVQPSLNNSNNSNMVVAEIINEINSTQPSGNYSQNTHAMPIQRQQTQTQQRMPQKQAPQQQTPPRATPFRRPAPPPQQIQHTQQVQHPTQPSQQPTQRRSQRKSFLQKQKEKMKNKQVHFKEEVEERMIENESDSDSESESDLEDMTPIKDVVLKSKSKELSKPKFLKKDDVLKSDLNETKGLYSKAISFFTNDTKEPLLVLALVFAISMPVVNNLMTRFLPFLMAYGDGSLFVVGVKSLLVALTFYTVKKLLL
jgi:hypothetical protein